MSKPSHVEDIFLEFIDLVIQGNFSLQNQDFSASLSFHKQITLGNQLTANQANFLLKILKKYQSDSKIHGLDYNDQLSHPLWKTAFRKLDLSKKIWIENSPERGIEILLKFPFSLKDTFDKEISSRRDVFSLGKWDPEKRLRVLELHECNVIQLNEFVNSHSFEIDESFRFLVSQVEEIWAEQEELIPRCEIVRGKVEIFNYTDNAKSFFEKARQEDISKDLFLAKGMGYILKNQEESSSKLEKICSIDQNFFWLKSNYDFFEIFSKVDGVSAVVLDRNTKDVVTWLKKFVEDADDFGISRNDIKICFRESSDAPSTLNSWIKENQLGGKVDQGKILIFSHKPAKWLFKNDIDVKIIAVNSFTPVNEPLCQSWIDSHPCVFYIGDIKPTAPRMKKIVNL